MPFVSDELKKLSEQILNKAVTKIQGTTPTTNSLLSQIIAKSKKPRIF